jgi:hypothetical protein
MTVGADVFMLAATPGTYKVSAKQDKFKITGTFEVVTQ